MRDSKYWANVNMILTDNKTMLATEGGGGLADRMITVRLLGTRDGARGVRCDPVADAVRGNVAEVAKEGGVS